MKNKEILAFPLKIYDQYFIWLKKRRVDFILNCLINKIKSVHFAIIDLKRKIEYDIVKYPIISLIKGN